MATVQPLTMKTLTVTALYLAIAGLIARAVSFPDLKMQHKTAGFLMVYLLCLPGASASSLIKADCSDFIDERPMRVLSLIHI